MLQSNSIYSQGMQSFGSLDSDERMEVLLNNYIKPIPDSFTPPSHYSMMDRQSYNADTVPVRIAQHEQDMMMDGSGMGMGMGLQMAMEDMDNIYGGLWEDIFSQQQKQYPVYVSELEAVGDHQQMESYLRPSLSLTTDNLELSSSMEYNSLYPQSSFNEEYSFYQDAPSYSNEPSPFFNHRQIIPPSSSLPRTPVTPAINPFDISTPGYIMVPTTVHHMDGTSHMEYVPKMVSYISPQSPLDLDYHNYCLEQTSHNPPRSQSQQCQFNNHVLASAYTSSPELTMSEGKGNSSNGDASVDGDGPELVGMGLYDDPPDLVHSSFSSPETVPICLLNSGSGRGLVLEESFDASDNGEEDDGEEEDEEDDEE